MYSSVLPTDPLTNPEARCRIPGDDWDELAEAAFFDLDGNF
jgi:hypothetical protein